MSKSSTVHASAVLIAARAFGAKAVLIRGPSGAGKSRLALALIEAGRAGTINLARLVADDRAFLEARNGRLLVLPPAELAGLLEVRGLGLRRLAFEPVAVVGLVVDLAGDAGRMPNAESRHVTLEGIALPRLMASGKADVLPVLLAYLQSADSGI